MVESDGERKPLYVITYSDHDEYLIPVAATLDEDQAEEIREACVDHIHAQRKERWQALFDDDPEGVLPWDDDQERREAEDWVRVRPWDVAFHEPGDAVDPWVTVLIEKARTDYGGEW